jgi:hypothetical protein
MSSLLESEIVKLKIVIILMAIATTLGWQARAQTYDTNNEVVQTFVGSAFSGYLDGQGQLTMFNSPNAIVADSHSNLFVWDSNNYRIRKIAPDGTVTTFAGGSSGNNYQATGTNVTFPYNFTALTIDRNDTIWASSISATWLWKITSGAVVTYTNFSAFVNVANGGIPGVCVDSAGTFIFHLAVAIKSTNTMPTEPAAFLLALATLVQLTETVFSLHLIALRLWLLIPPTTSTFGIREII